MSESEKGLPRGRRALLWTARIMATLIVLFVLTMAVGYAVNPNEPMPEDFEILLLALFPVGMCVGYILAWWKPLAGGIVSVAAIVVFLVALGEADMLAIMSFLGVPGVLFIVYGVRSRDEVVATGR